MKKFIFLLLFIIMLTLSCSSYSPINSIKSELNRFPEYTIILQDMKEEGNFFPSYYHRYKIIYKDNTETSETPTYRTFITGWYDVKKGMYRDFNNFLGMTVASKTQDGTISNTNHPPGYQYVGNQRYGQWRNDSSGNSFWEFYGKFAMLNAAFSMFRRPIYRSNYNDYRRHSSSGRPFYGSNREYGTSGSQTKQNNKSFFQRRKARDLARKSRFRNRIGQRVRRSNMSGYRSRSFGFGK